MVDNSVSPKSQLRMVTLYGIEYNGSSSDFPSEGQDHNPPIRGVNNPRKIVKDNIRTSKIEGSTTLGVYLVGGN